MAIFSALKKHPFLALEFALLCLALPTIIIAFRLAPHMLSFLWVTTAVCVYLYRRVEEREPFRNVWKPEAVTWKNLRPILLRWVFSSVALIVFVYLYDPARAFGFIQENTEMWLLVMFFYPVLSALPQEFIFCTYFFARFRQFFTTTRAMVIASAIVFAYAHVLFINPVAPILSLIGGYIFASTYAKHRSLWLVAIEHALYGNTLFTVGLGWYFWGGSVQH